MLQQNRVLHQVLVLVLVCNRIYLLVGVLVIQLLEGRITSITQTRYCNCPNRHYTTLLGLH
jgi:hypothetical protein